MMKQNLLNDELDDVLVDVAVADAQGDDRRHQVFAEFADFESVIGRQLKTNQRLIANKNRAHPN